MPAKRIVNATVFLSIALAAHIALAAVRVPQLEEGSEAAGAGGEDVLSLEAATAGTVAMVEAWERPPEVASETPAPEAIELPDVPTDVPLPLATETAPKRPTSESLAAAPPPPDMPIETPEAPEPPKLAEAPTQKPKPKPEAPPQKPRETPAPQVERSVAGGETSSQKTRAAGSGGGPQAGNAGAQANATLSSSAVQSRLSNWGGAIRSRIERRKRAPRGAGEGTVVLSVSIARSGALVGVRVAASSGNGALDAAAVDAVRRAGSFPPAPDGLNDPQYSFRLPIRFTG